MEACDSEIREAQAKKGPTESGVNPGSSGGLVYVRRRVEVVDTAKATKEAIQGATSSSSSSRHRLEWEERYHNLQMLLNKLNDSDQTEDHVQMLWSLSSAELSKHAVELEKRSIQFSLEEAREMQRVAALNVLGRSPNSLKSNDKAAVDDVKPFLRMRKIDEKLGMEGLWLPVILKSHHTSTNFYKQF